MRILVTGSSGFIGTHLVERLNEDGHKVFGIDRVEPTNHKCDELGVGELSKYIENKVDEDLRIDAVIHLAATVSVIEAGYRPLKSHENNATLTLRLLGWMRGQGINKMIFASSAAVYGDQNESLYENNRTNPISAYGIQKLNSENYINLYNKQHGMKNVILRLFNVFGEGQGEKNPGVVKTFLEDGGKHSIYGDGEQTRCFVYVKDVVDAIVKSLESSATGTLNIADNEKISINKLAVMIGGEKDYRMERAGEIRSITVSTERAGEILGWCPRVKLKDWIKEQKKYEED